MVTTVNRPLSVFNQYQNFARIIGLRARNRNAESIIFSSYLGAS